MTENDVKNSFEALKANYILEAQRIESFKRWPFPDTAACSKRKMAEAGWYWTGTDKEPDAATCFLCNKTLDGWEESDDPWKEHAKHAPRCDFVKLSKPESDLSVNEMLDIFNIVVGNRIKHDFEQIKSTFRSQANDKLKAYMKDNSK